MAYSNAQHAALYYARKRRRQLANEAAIELTEKTVKASAANASEIGVLYVRRRSGFDFTLADDAGELFALVGDRIVKNDTLAAGDKHVIEVTATDGDIILRRHFLITVTA